MNESDQIIASLRTGHQLRPLRDARAWEREIPPPVTLEDLRASWRRVRAAHAAGTSADYQAAQQNFNQTLERILNQ